MHFWAVLVLALVIPQAATESKEYTPPTFTNCPAQKITTTNARYQLPTLKATDESGTPTITKVQGPDGPVFSVGNYIFIYRARDKWGNTNTCTFIFQVKAADCATPTHDDQDVKFTCNGRAHGSVCQLSCKSGTSVEGERHIKCVTDSSTTENRSVWKTVTGKPGKCFKKKCEALKAPARGALICDMTTGGTLCQVMCGRSYDVKKGSGFASTYICTSSNTEWKPWSSVADCLESKSSTMRLPNKDYYFDGQCDSAKAQIRRNFVSNMKTLQIQTCNGKKCTDEQLEVTCGGDLKESNIWTRRKRSPVMGMQLQHNRPRRFSGLFDRAGKDIDDETATGDEDLLDETGGADKLR